MSISRKVEYISRHMLEGVEVYKGLKSSEDRVADMHFKLRPHVKEFLAWAKTHFDLHVFTAASYF